MKPREILFWAFLAVLGALAVHAALALLLPRRIMAGIFQRAEAMGAVNAFVVADRDRLPAFLQPLPEGGLAGFCLVRPGEEAVLMDAPVDGGYWSITAYAPDGSVAFALDDRHALGEVLHLVFARSAQEDTLTSNSLRTPTLRGERLYIPLEHNQVLAVVRLHAPYPGLSPRLRESLARTHCAPKPRAALLRSPARKADAAAPGTGAKGHPPLPQRRPAFSAPDRSAR